MNIKLIIFILAVPIIMSTCTCSTPAKVSVVTITSIKPTADMLYSQTATVNVHVKLDQPAGGVGYTGYIELWEATNFDDQITKKKKFTIPANKTRKNITISIECTDKGELKGDYTDTDNGTAGEVRTYLLYAYETKGVSSSEKTVTCSPVEEEGDLDHK